MVLNLESLPVTILSLEWRNYGDLILTEQTDFGPGCLSILRLERSIVRLTVPIVGED